MSHPVTHFEVVGRDAEGLQRFYAEAFGWEVQPAGPAYAMVHPGGPGGINGGVGAAPDGGAGHVTFYVESEDLEATLAKIEGLGGRIIMAPADVPGGPRIGMFADPEGHMVGLVQARGG